MKRSIKHIVHTLHSKIFKIKTKPVKSNGVDKIYSRDEMKRIINKSVKEIGPVLKKLANE